MAQLKAMGFAERVIILRAATDLMLLRRAAAAFDLLTTVDRNLEYQQSFEGLSLAVIVVHASSNDVTILRPFYVAVLHAIAQTRPGVVTHVGE